MTPEDHIAVVHGNMTINVPRSIFIGDGAVPDTKRTKAFRKMMMERYPWLSENSMDVIMRNARNMILKMMDEETCGRAGARRLISENRVEEAILHLKRFLEKEPENADSWYLLGEVLCKAGMTDEGYAAFSRGRDLF